MTDQDVTPTTSTTKTMQPTANTPTRTERDETVLTEAIEIPSGRNEKTPHPHPRRDATMIPTKEDAMNLRGNTTPTNDAATTPPENTIPTKDAEMNRQENTIDMKEGGTIYQDGEMIHQDAERIHHEEGMILTEEGTDLQEGTMIL